MNKSWYPGHMARALEDMKKFIRLVDIVIEVVDSRAPISSRDAVLDKMIGHKARIIVLNKADLADKRAVDTWLKYLKSKDVKATAINAKSGADISKLKDIMRSVENRHKDRRVKNAMIVGIPNVGKSTILNALAKSRRTQVGARPGITRQVGWFKVDEFQIMDTPGILKPNLKNEIVKLHLACIGAIDDAAVDIEEIAVGLLDILQSRYLDRLSQRYGVSITDKRENSYELLSAICMNKGWLKSGGEADIHRGAAALIDDFRKGAIGPITLEMPPAEG
ncbi:MAG: ribosome biosis GTPase [Clostridiales bacterium]|nr:ribosome biosis GTPase [Clostridiales bacterium]MDK2991315.1 ribosome biosis GTPase [Clostridiales bacterium]